MKKILVTVFFIFLLYSTNAQSYGNEWIKNNQKYFKIKIGKPGIYRIDYTSLIPAATDMNLSLPSVNPKKWQMFYQGKVIPIYVAGENDNVFNVGDFIEFYAQLNDGALDRELYNNPLMLANDKVSMVTDSSTYYLTFVPISSTEDVRHMKNYNFTNYGAYPEMPYFMHESTVSYTTDYNYGKGYNYGSSEAMNPEYKTGEGFCGVSFGSGTNYANFNAAVESRFLSSSGPLPLLSFVTVGNSSKIRDTALIRYDHFLKVYISNNNSSFNQIDSYKFDGFSITRKTMNIDRSSVGGNNTYVRFDAQFIPGVPYQANAVNYVSLRYPKNFDLDGQTTSKFEVPGSANPRHIEWQNYNPNKYGPLIYDLSSGYRIRGEKYNGTNVRFFLPAGTDPSNCYIHDTTDITYLVAKDLSAAISYETKFSDMDLIKFDPSKVINKNKLVLLTNEKMVGEYTNQYLSYKQTSYPCDLVTVQQLYNHFSYGVPHPIAIKRYIKYLKDNGDTTLKSICLGAVQYPTAESSTLTWCHPWVYQLLTICSARAL